MAKKIKNRVAFIIRLLKKDNYPKGAISPNNVNEFAWAKGIEDLTSEEIVQISNTY